MGRQWTRRADSRRKWTRWFTFTGDLLNAAKLKANVEKCRRPRIFTSLENGLITKIWPNFIAIYEKNKTN
jgi:hypothetical protein